MADRIVKLNKTGWIAEHREVLKPPVSNAVVWTDTDFIIMVIGGPNQRTDFHDDPFEEMFYQIRGDMHLNVMTEAGPGRIEVPEGHVYLMPPHLRHSPQRPEAGSLGLVIERVRANEAFEWYCEACHRLLHRAEVEVRDIELDLAPVFAEFHARMELRTCPDCATVHPGQG